MFTHEPDGGEGSLSGKILDLVKSGDKVDVHFTSCKMKDAGMFKKHVVWLTDGKLIDVSETAGDDDDFPTEKVTGEFSEVERDYNRSAISSLVEFIKISHLLFFNFAKSLPDIT